MGKNNWRALLLYDRPSHCMEGNALCMAGGPAQEVITVRLLLSEQGILEEAAPASSAPPWVHYLGKVLKPCLGIDSTSYGVPGLLLWENGP